MSNKPTLQLDPSISVGAQRLLRLREKRLEKDIVSNQEHSPIAAASHDRPSEKSLVVGDNNTNYCATVDARCSEVHKTQGEKLRGKVQISQEASAVQQPIGLDISLLCSSRPTKSEQKPNNIVHAKSHTIGISPVSQDHRNNRKPLGKGEMEWLDKNFIFNQRIALLEKERDAWWESYYHSNGYSQKQSQVSTSDFKFIISEIQNMKNQLGLLRANEIAAIREQLHAIREQSNAVRRRIEQNNFQPECLAELPNLIDLFEENVRRFRQEHQRQYNGYILEEHMLDNELKEFQSKVDSTMTTVRKDDGIEDQVSRQGKNSMNIPIINSKKHCDQKNKQNDDTIVKKVRQLSAMVAESLKFQLNSDWDEQEHQQFLSCLTRCGLTDDILLNNQQTETSSSLSQESIEIFEKRINLFKNKSSHTIVTKHSDAIQNHLTWYIRHIQLIAARKSLLQQWKAKKTSHPSQWQVGNTSVESTSISPLEKNISENKIAQLESVNRKAQLESMKKEETKKQLELWKEEKERKRREKLELQHQQDREVQYLAEKKRQAHLISKQKVLLYKLQKQQEASLAQQHSSANASSNSAASSSNEFVMELSRIAIDRAKAQRRMLDERNARKKRCKDLPPRPQLQLKRETSPSLVTTALTKARAAKCRSRTDIIRLETSRKNQTAHEKYFPGVQALSDAKFKSFGHRPIQPRCIPAWRQFK